MSTLVAEQSRSKTPFETRKLSEVASVVNGGTPKSKVAEFWNGSHQWLTPADMGKMEGREIGATPRTITDQGLAKSSTRLVPPRSVILSTRAPIGHLAINSVPMAFNQGCRGLVPGERLDHVFLYYFLQANRDLLNDLGTGTTFKELSATNLKSVEIPLPPLEEQKRIVAVLDQAFAALDRARANAEANLADADVVYRSQLASVFDAKKLDTLRLADVCDVRDGTHDTPKYVEDGVPLVTQKNVRWDGMHFEKCKNISQSDHEEISKRSKVERGDILVSMIGVNRGECCLVESDKDFSIKNVGLVRKTPAFEMQYLLQYLQSPMAAKYIDFATNGGAQPFVGLGKLRDFPVPKISISDQEKALEDLLAIRSHVKTLAAKCQEKLDDLEDLRQSILQKAFAGELT